MSLLNARILSTARGHPDRERPHFYLRSYSFILTLQVRWCNISRMEGKRICDECGVEYNVKWESSGGVNPHFKLTPESIELLTLHPQNCTMPLIKLNCGIHSGIRKDGQSLDCSKCAYFATRQSEEFNRSGILFMGERATPEQEAVFREMIRDYK